MALIVHQENRLDGKAIVLNELKALGEARRWRLFVDAAKEAATADGSVLTKIPGRGLSNVYSIKSPDGTQETVCIRTSMDRWFAFPPLDGGKRWKTLDDVDAVFVAAVDERDAPSSIEVFRFPAAEVRERFKQAYVARTKAGMAVRDNFGMWIGLSGWTRGSPSDVGSGLGDKYKPIAAYPLTNLLKGVKAVESTDSEEIDSEDLAPALDEISPVPKSETAKPPETISDVMRHARERISRIAGVSLEAVKLDLRLEV